MPVSVPRNDAVKAQLSATPLVATRFDFDRAVTIEIRFFLSDDVTITQGRFATTGTDNAAIGANVTRILAGELYVYQVPEGRQAGPFSLFLASASASAYVDVRSVGR